MHKWSCNSEEVLWHFSVKPLCSAMFFKTGMAADFWALFLLEEEKSLRCFQLSFWNRVTLSVQLLFPKVNGKSFMTAFKLSLIHQVQRYFHLCVSQRTQQPHSTNCDSCGICATAGESDKILHCYEAENDKITDFWFLCGLFVVFIFLLVF